MISDLGSIYITTITTMLGPFYSNNENIVIGKFSDV